MVYKQKQSTKAQRLGAIIGIAVLGVLIACVMFYELSK